MALEGGRQGAGPQLSAQGPGIGQDLCGGSQAAAPSRAVSEGELAARPLGRSLPCAGRSRVVPVSLGCAGGVTPGTFPLQSCPRIAPLPLLTWAPGHCGLAGSGAPGLVPRHGVRGWGEAQRSGTWCVPPAVPVPVLLPAVPLQVVGGQCLHGVQRDAPVPSRSLQGTAPLPGGCCPTGSRILHRSCRETGGSESGGQGQQAGAQPSAEVRCLCPGCPGVSSPTPGPGCVFPLARPSASPCSRPGYCCRLPGQEAARGGCGFGACMTWRLRVPVADIWQGAGSQASPRCDRGTPGAGQGHGALAAWCRDSLAQGRDGPCAPVVGCRGAGELPDPCSLTFPCLPPVRVLLQHCPSLRCASQRRPFGHHT